MEAFGQLKREISRRFSSESIRINSNNGIRGRSRRLSFRRQLSSDPRLGNGGRFIFGRQSSLDPRRRSLIRTASDAAAGGLTVPDNLSATMQLLFLACRGDAAGVEELIGDGVDVNSIDLDGRTALHIAACEGHVEVVKLLLDSGANIDARDRWGSTPTTDARYYGNIQVYNILKSCGATIAKAGKTPMTVSNPREVPEYEVNPSDLQFRRGEDIFKGTCQVAKWNGTKVSLKVLDKDSYSDPDSINAFKQELNLLQKVRHPNVVQFLGAVTQNIPMMIISEYHPKGDLASYLQRKGRLKNHKALRLALDIARGMNYLHECKPDPIIHCDLKPKNVLLDDGGLKVTGFGLIQLSNISPDKVKLACPAVRMKNISLYMAPEVYKNEIFDKSVDAFSFGLILYEMIEGTPAFHPKAPEIAVKMICIEGSRPSLRKQSKSYLPDLKESRFGAPVPSTRSSVGGAGSFIPVAQLQFQSFRSDCWLIEECWDTNPVVRPSFPEMIMRLDKMYATHTKQVRWKDTFKLPWK